MPSWVYAITSKSNNSHIYVGCTTGKYFCLRKGEHTRPSTSNSGKQSNLYGYIKDNGGWENFTFEILKEFDKIDRSELLNIEKEFIKNLHPVCNKISPIVTYEEHLENARKKCKLYRERHPEYVKNIRNMESHIRYEKKRCSTKIECPCGGRYTLQNKTNHFSRDIHKKYENEKTKTEECG